MPPTTQRQAGPPANLPQTLPQTLPPIAAPLRGAGLAEQLAARFAERIEQRLLAAGARLPSVRDCAARHGVSPSTVVGAYDLLQARGLIEARPQRGFFVRAAATPPTPAQAAAVRHPAAPPPPPPVDATALIRGMFQAQQGRPSPGMGTLPPAWLDAPLLQRALRRGLRDAEGWLGYGEPAGDPRLRAALSRRLADLGLPATPAQIVTTVGATQALDIVSRTLLAPGDAVLVDEPGWSVEFARLARMGLRVLPVPRSEGGGPDLAVMAALAREHRPRLYVTVSVLHNPTGHCLSAAEAHQVLQLAEAHDFLIVEDDTYAWLAPPRTARMAELDGLRRTITVSGFSKILAPQWRVGFLAASPALVERFIDTKLLTTLTSPGVLEAAVADCLEQGLLRRHAERVTALLQQARARTVRLAQAAGCRFVAPPAGLFGWLDTGRDTEALALALLEEGWLTAPGSLFHARPRPTTLMRVNFATADEPRFWQRLKALIDAPARPAGGVAPATSSHR